MNTIAQTGNNFYSRQSFFRVSAAISLRILILFLLLFSHATQAQKILINELLAANATILSDENDEFDDWVELHNTGNAVFDLAGCYLTDNLNRKDKWVFPAGKPELTVIQPNGFLLVWCDNDVVDDSADPDEDYSQYLDNEEPVKPLQLHAAFKLNSKGEALYLIDKNGKTVIDSVRFPKQYADFTYGRFEQGGEWSYFIEPTPLKPNSGTQKITDVCPQPEFALKPGFYKQKIEVEIFPLPGFDIYYSTDGSEPIPDISLKYSGPIRVEKTTVIRARAFKEGWLPGVVLSGTYFINENITVPTVSIITKSSNLWDTETGIYANPYFGNEIPAHFEYLEHNDTVVFSQNTALKIFGNTSRNSSKQSFAVLAKDKFGKSRMSYPFFKDKPHVKSVDGVILRGDATSGRGGGDRETAGERVKNELIYHLNKQAGGHIDIQAYQPVTLFINGAYWGLYNLMERKGADFIMNNHGEKDADILSSYHLHEKKGDKSHWMRILDYISDKYIEYDDIFKKLESWIDLESLMDYWIFEIYTATHDYKVNNRMWRPRAPEGRWRIIAYDEDSWGNFEEPTIDELTSENYAETIFILGALLENKSFRNRFINRFADLLNTALTPENINRLIDEIQEVIKYEKQRDYDRWKNLLHFVEPGSQIAYLKEFAEKRPAYLRNEIVDRFELPGQTSFTIDIKGKGKVKINTIIPAEFPWSGVYFQDAPVTLTAIPDQGHRFTGWSDEKLPHAETVVIPLTVPHYKIIAKFE